MEQFLLDVARDALMTIIKIGAPVLLIGLIVGLAVSIFRLTQIQEQSLHLSKIIAMLLALLLLGSGCGHVERVRFRMYDNMLKLLACKR